MIAAFITIIIAFQLLLISYFIKKNHPNFCKPEEESREEHIKNSDPEKDKTLILIKTTSKISLTGYAGLVIAGIQIIFPQTALPLFFLYLLIIIPVVLVKLFIQIKKATLN